MRQEAIALLILCCTLPAAATPACFPSDALPEAKIVRVKTNGVLALSSGREANLEGIVLPAGERDHAPNRFAEKAIANLVALATGRVARIALAQPANDRYGRIRAQIITKEGSGEIWLQRVMVSSGLARVAIAPDRRECAHELYEAEEHARASRLGIWSSTAYRVRTPAELVGDGGTFQIVKGKVAAVMRSGSRVFLDFAQPGEFSGVISADDLRNFHRIGVDPFAYQGHDVRVRGWMETINDRSEIDLATPDDVEVTDQR